MTKQEEKKYIYAIGRRKTATARVRLFPNGKGNITVNGKDYKDFFPFDAWNQNLTLPFDVVGATGDYDVEIKVLGGGNLSGSEACRLGISRALVLSNEDWKGQLRAAGYLTRDPRAKERKKYGLKKARRSPQWSKR